MLSPAKFLVAPLLATSGMLAVAVSPAQNTKDVQKTISDMDEFTKEVQNYQPGRPIGIVPVTFDTLQSDLKTDLADCSSLSRLSEANSKSFLSLLSQSFEPTLKNMISALKAKKSQFVAGGLKSSYNESVNDFHNATDTWLDCVGGKVATDQVQTYKGIRTKVDNDFQGALITDP